MMVSHVTLAEAQKNPPARGSLAAAPLHQRAKGRSAIRLWAWRHPPAGGKVNPQGRNGERAAGPLQIYCICRFLMPCDETILVQKQITARALQEHQHQICTSWCHPTKSEYKKQVAPQKMEKLMTKRQKHRKALHSPTPAGRLCTMTICRYNN